MKDKQQNQTLARRTRCALTLIELAAERPVTTFAALSGGHFPGFVAGFDLVEDEPEDLRVQHPRSVLATPVASRVGARGAYRGSESRRRE